MATTISVRNKPLKIRSRHRSSPNVLLLLHHSSLSVIQGHLTLFIHLRLHLKSVPLIFLLLHRGGAGDSLLKSLISGFFLCVNSLH